MRGEEEEEKESLLLFWEKISFVPNAFSQNIAGLLCNYQSCAHGSER